MLLVAGAVIWQTQGKKVQRSEAFGLPACGEKGNHLTLVSALSIHWFIPGDHLLIRSTGVSLFVIRSISQ